MMKWIYKGILTWALLGLSGCAVLEVGDLVVSGATTVVSAGVSVVSTGVHAVGSVLDAITPDFKSK
jgi:hypothetical protein